MDGRSVPSLQAVIRTRRQVTFVGREDYITAYIENLRMHPVLDDTQRKYIFAIAGPPGVGKTTLLQRYVQIAERENAVTAICDESQGNALDVMASIADSLGKRGYTLKTFTERYQEYRALAHKLESSDDSPNGLPALAGRALVKTGVDLLRQVPVGGSLVNLVNEDLISDQASEWITFIARKLKSADEVGLVQRPLSSLTPLFVQDVNKLAPAHTIALFFDAHEQTNGYLDPWLHRILEGTYGELTSNIVVTIAGQEELDRNQWSAFEGLGMVANIHLDPFTSEEIKDYLSCHGIDTERAVSDILAVTGGLPVLLATVIDGNVVQTGAPNTATGTAAERFLMRVNDLRHRELLLDSAIPRVLNQDILSTLAPNEDVGPLFDWLQSRPILKHTDSGWAFHPVVRTLLLRHKHISSPEEWAKLHGDMATHYEQVSENLGLRTTPFRDLRWQEANMEAAYHRLCQHRSDTSELSSTLNGSIAALVWYPSLATRWAQTLLQASEDVRRGLDDPWSERLHEWGQRFLDISRSFAEQQYAKCADLIGKAIELVDIKPEYLSAVFGWQGGLYNSADRFEDAIPILTKAIELARKPIEVHRADRALALLQTGRYEQALYDFDALLELNTRDSWARAYRGRVYEKLQKYDQALVDYDAAIGMVSDDPVRAAPWYHMRGMLLHLLGRYSDALADFEHHRDAHPANDEEFAHWLLHKGSIAADKGNFQEALDDFTQAVTLSPRSAIAAINRAAILQYLRSFDEALQEADRAIHIQPDDSALISRRGEIYFALEKYNHALADFNQAIKCVDDDSSTRTRCLRLRGRTYGELDRYEESMRDFDEALRLTPNNPLVVGDRARALQLLGHYEYAIREFARAIELSHQDSKSLGYWYLFRGETYVELQSFQKALIDFDHALEHLPSVPDVYLSRAGALRRMQRYTEALRDLDTAARLDPNSYIVALVRGEATRGLGNYDEAIAYFKDAITLDPARASHRAEKDIGLTLLGQGRFQDAATAFVRALSDTPACGYCWDALAEALKAANPASDLRNLLHEVLVPVSDTTSARYRARALAKAGHMQEAFEDLSIVMNTVDTEIDGGMLTDVGDILAALGRFQEALEVYERARTIGPAHLIDYRVAVATVRWKGVGSSRGMINRARSELESSRRVPTKADRLYGLAGIFAITGERAKALTLLKQAISFDPELAKWARYDTAWQMLRSNTTFQSILESVQAAF